MLGCAKLLTYRQPNGHRGESPVHGWQVLSPPVARMPSAVDILRNTQQKKAAAQSGGDGVEGQGLMGGESPRSDSVGLEPLPPPTGNADSDFKNEAAAWCASSPLRAFGCCWRCCCWRRRRQRRRLLLSFSPSLPPPHQHFCVMPWERWS